MIKVDTSAFEAAMKEATEKLAGALGEQAMRATGFEGARIFRDQAKINASNSESLAGRGPATRTGTLRDNIIVKRLEEEGSDTRQSYLVTVRTGKYGTEGDAFYWRFVEDGHKFVRRGKGKKDTIKKRRVEALEFGTSTAPAYPFMRPAYESKKQEAADAMGAKLAEIIKERLGGS